MSQKHKNIDTEVNKAIRKDPSILKKAHQVKMNYINDPDIDEYSKARLMKMSDKEFFKNYARDVFREGVSNAEEAISTVIHKREFLGLHDLFKENFVKGIMSNKPAKRQLYSMLGLGEKAKLDPDKVKWDSYNQIYIYDNRIGINFDNSPLEIVLFWLG